MGTPKTTKRLSVCPFFGAPKVLSQSVLPTCEDVLLACFEETSKSVKNESFSKISHRVAAQIEEVYCKASIPTVSRERIVKLIKDYHDKYYTLRKSFSRDKEKFNFKTKLNQFVSETKSKLFDVAFCKCVMNFTCSCGKKPISCDCKVIMECRCDKGKKIPIIEREFLYDQRNSRLKYIATLDRVETNRIVKRNERIQIEKKNEIVVPDIKASKGDTLINSAQNTQIESHEANCDSLPSTSQMRIKLPATALISDRYGISDRATAAIASCLLQDVGMINEGDMSLVIDKSKIRREKQRNRYYLQTEHPNTNVYGVYFDGRKDNTYYQERNGNKMYRRLKKEEHISLVQEPGGKYVGHLTPQRGTGSEIANSILCYLESKNFDYVKLVAIGCDGTATNTGWKNGVIRNLEVKLGRPLQWFICLLHFNELPFRHLFESVDGDTTGPTSFSGQIGKQLSGCEKLPVANFETINSEDINVTKTDLSKDQQYLLDIYRAVKTGECAPDLAVKDPGPLSHSRWLTCANRILRLYISEVKPSDELKMLVSYIMKIYAPVWFEIKMHPSVKFGPVHMFKVVQTTRQLPDSVRKIIDPVIQRNAFFCHPENMLISMAVDERVHVRQLAFRRLLKARKQEPKGKSVRTFQPPTINFAASDYIELIDWSKCKLSSPPIMNNVSTESLEQLINTDVLPEFELMKFPCHTQSVERIVKLVTESCTKVCGEENRDGFIRATLLSRSAMPSFNFKSQFKTMPNTFEES